MTPEIGALYPAVCLFQEPFSFKFSFSTPMYATTEEGVVGWEGDCAAGLLMLPRLIPAAHALVPSLRDSRIPAFALLLSRSICIVANNAPNELA